MNIVSENIIDPSDINRNKLDTINRLHNLLIEMVPKFIEFAQIEYELEKFYE